MSHNNVQIRLADWRLDQKALQQIREQVFVEEQAVPLDMEWDGKDSSAIHVLALDSERQPIATGRLLNSGKIGRMAVLAEWRQQGVGSEILKLLIEQARQRGMTNLYCHAQVEASQFYSRHGFEAVGEVFDEAGIAHRKMQMTMAAIDSKQIDTDDTDKLMLGTAQQIHLNNPTEFRQALLQLACQARKRVCLFSFDLYNRVYDQQALANCLQKLAISNPNPSLLILLQNNQRVQREGHRLVDLAGRLPSKIRIFRPQLASHLDLTENFMLFDDRAYIYQKLHSQWQASGDCHHPVRTRELQRRFDDIWEQSQEDSVIRRLSI